MKILYYIIIPLTLFLLLFISASNLAPRLLTFGLLFLVIALIDHYMFGNRSYIRVPSNIPDPYSTDEILKEMVDEAEESIIVILGNPIIKYLTKCTQSDVFQNAAQRGLKITFLLTEQIDLEYLPILFRELKKFIDENLIEVYKINGNVKAYFIMIDRIHTLIAKIDNDNTRESRMYIHAPQYCDKLYQAFREYQGYAKRLNSEDLLTLYDDNYGE